MYIRKAALFVVHHRRRSLSFLRISDKSREQTDTPKNEAMTRLVIIFLTTFDVFIVSLRLVFLLTTTETNVTER